MLKWANISLETVLILFVKTNRKFKAVWENKLFTILSHDGWPDHTLCAMTADRAIIFSRKHESNMGQYLICKRDSNIRQFLICKRDSNIRQTLIRKRDSNVSRNQIRKLDLNIGQNVICKCDSNIGQNLILNVILP